MITTMSFRRPPRRYRSQRRRPCRRPETFVPPEVVASKGAKIGTHTDEGFDRLMHFYETLFEYTDIDGDGRLNRKEFALSQKLADMVPVPHILGEPEELCEACVCL